MYVLIVTFVETRKYIAMILDSARKEEVDHIEKMVCEHFGVDCKEIVNKKGKQEVAIARAFIFYILHVDKKYMIKDICEIYQRKPNGVFKIIAKTRYLINNHKMYKKMYKDICG